MELTYAEFLSREQLLQNLRNRGLESLNLEELPDERLKQIFASFAMPLAKRESRANRRQPVAPRASDDNVTHHNGDKMEIDDAVVLPSLKSSHFHHEKRVRKCEITENEEFLSIATKRIRISFS